MITENWTRQIFNSPRQEFSNGGLGLVVALLGCWQIIFRVRLADRKSSCTKLVVFGTSCVCVFTMLSAHCF